MSTSPKRRPPAGWQGDGRDQLRAAAIRYKKAFDRYIEQHSEYGFIHSLVAFSGKMTGKQVMHQDDSEFKDDVFIVDENEEFTEQA